MNPINLFGNPQQFLKQMMGNNQVMNNPMAKNALDMAQKGDMKGIEQLARNLGKEQGTNVDELMKQIRSKFGL